MNFRASVIFIIAVGRAGLGFAESDLLEPSTSNASPSSKMSVLEEVFVTATKRDKSLRDLPASVSAFDGGDLEEKAILSINEVLEQTPGVTANAARPGDQRIVMRGISTGSSFSSVVPQPVGIFIGDTALNEPYAASVTPDLSAFDLASVEILKGPQGTLFGGAALSGVLRYKLNAPSPDQWELRYFAQNVRPDDGSDALTQGLVVNVPILGEGGDLGLRVGMIRREYPGIIDNVRSGQEQKNVNEGEGDQVRAALLWQPSDALQMKLSYLEQDYDADNSLFISDNRGGPRQTKGSLLPWPSQHRFGLYNFEVQYDWEDMSLVSSSSRTEKERMSIIDSYGALLGMPPDSAPDALAIPYKTDQESTSFQQEIRLQSLNNADFEWLVGVYYLRSPIRYDLKLNLQALNLSSWVLNNTLQNLFDALGDSSITALLDQLLDPLFPANNNVDCELAVLCAETKALAKEKAVFFDTTWYLGSRLELSAGARIYETSVDGGFVGEGLVVRLINNGVSPADFRADITEDGINPKVSATYRFNDDISFYVLANKGFRFGGIQNIPADELQNVPGTYKSDYIWNYEFGMRTSWLDNRLELDVTAFHIDYNDALVTLKNAYSINYYDNVGSAESDGVEANMRWLTPIPGVVMTLNWGTANAHTKEDFMAGQDLVASGTPLPGSADYQYSANLAFFGSPDWLVNVSAYVGYNYVGKTYSDMKSNETINDYGTYNLGMNMSIPSVSGRPSLALSVTNLTDETAEVGLIPGASGNDFYVLNSPRTLTARLSLEFD